MRRGSTPTCTFKTLTDPTGAEVMFITFMQEGKTIVEKSKKDITIDEEVIEKEGKEITIYKISTTLDQTDTLGFSIIGNMQMQVDMRFPVTSEYPEGKRLISNIIDVPVERVLKEGVI